MKVKITVLATGFGMEYVPGVDSVLQKRSQEEEERQMLLEEEKEKNKELSLIHISLDDLLWSPVPTIRTGQNGCDHCRIIYSIKETR